MKTEDLGSAKTDNKTLKKWGEMLQMSQRDALGKAGSQVQCVPVIFVDVQESY
jgi:hypothetical protein